MARKAKAVETPHRTIPLSPLGKRIDELATKRKLCRSELGARAGISIQTLGLILNGTSKSTTVEYAISISKALGVRVEALFAETDANSGSKGGRPAIIPLSPFGAKLIRRMDLLGITREDLAKKTGINGVTIWRWMRGKSRVPLAPACRLAKALNCEVKELLPEIG